MAQLILNMGQETAQLIEFLQATARNGETSLTYQQIADATGLGRENGLRGRLYTAMKYLDKRGVVWRVLRGIGLRLLSDGEIVQGGRRHVHKAAREMRKGARMVALANPENLTPDERQHRDLTLSQSRLVRMMLHKSAEGRFIDAPKNYELADRDAVLAAFMKKGRK